MSTTNFQSSGLRQKIDQLMDILWAGGVNNPMDAIEQVSYLIFLRLLSERDEQFAALSRTYIRLFSGAWTRYAWGNFVTLTGDALFDAIREAIEKLHELPNLSETGKLLFSRATLKIYDRPTLRAVVQLVDKLLFDEEGDFDLKGDMYEYLLSKLAASGTNGQFRTPRHIIDMIVQLVNPQPDGRSIDPACGTAGFLIAAFRHILRQQTPREDLERQHLSGARLTPAQWRFLQSDAFTGFDNDANMVKIAILNLYLHRMEYANIQFFNPLTTALRGGYPGQQYRYILANPPFAGKIQHESILEDINLTTRNTELLFLKWFMDHLEPGGRAGVIVPNGVLFGSTKAAVRLRQLLVTEFDLQAVLNLPSGAFKPYSGVGTAALIFEKPLPGDSPPGRGNGWVTEGEERSDTTITHPHPLPGGEFTDSPSHSSPNDGEGFVWFYDVTADGFSLDDKRTPTDANDIPDLLAKWPERAAGGNAYRVPVAKILEDASFSLSAGRYKPVQAEAAEHDAPQDILAEVLTYEQEIIQKTQALLNALH